MASYMPEPEIDKRVQALGNQHLNRRFISDGYQSDAGFTYVWDSGYSLIHQLYPWRRLDTLDGAFNDYLLIGVL